MILMLLTWPIAASSQATEDTVPVGWVSSPKPSGFFGSAYEACEAQWEYYQGDSPSSRYKGIRVRDDDWRTVDCEWTRFQYLCPEPGQVGGIANCGTIIPGSASLRCPELYYVTRDGLCRRNASREQACDDPCGDGGKPNPKTDNPVIISIGAKYLEDTDYASANGLFRIARQYRSFQVGRAIQQAILPRAQLRGLQGSWNFEFIREIQLGIFEGSPGSPNARVAILLPDGTGYGFSLRSDGSWQEISSGSFSSSSGNLKLEYLGSLPSDLQTVRNSASTWKLIDSNDTEWILETRNGLNNEPYVRGWPTSMTARSGYSQTFTYAGDGSLARLPTASAARRPLGGRNFASLRNPRRRPGLCRSRWPLRALPCPTAHPLITIIRICLF